MPSADAAPTAAMPGATAALLARVRAQLAGGRAEWQASGVAEARIAAERYHAPEVWQAELQALFRPLPLIVAHGSEIAPGQVLAHDGYGVPLLLARDAQGTLRCFLNVCRHRGMRLVEATGAAQARASVVCPYHGWAYRLDGPLRHMLHAEAFDACPAGARDLVPLPCAERHGLVWVVPDPRGSLDLPGYLDGLDAELPYLGIDRLRHFRTIEAEYPANWKLIIDAFLEPYHIRVLHKDTIYPYFTDGITAGERFGPHIYSLVARRAAQDWAAAGGEPPATQEALRLLATPSQVIFPNTVTIFHPDYLSLITLYPTGPETLRWTHRMLIPADKATPDWTPHWEKTFRLIEQGVFQKEDIHCAVGIQRGLKSGANTHLAVGRVEQALSWFHDEVARRLAKNRMVPPPFPLSTLSFGDAP
jgi:phenylpropionate dioxygenase-like ring-hydroxylating dioxygenase large terminal subunit